MGVSSILKKIILPTTILLFASCQITDLAQSSAGIANNSTSLKDPKIQSLNPSLSNILSLKDITAKAAPIINVDQGFVKAVAAAVKSDPKVRMARSELLQRQAKLGVTKSQLNFQFSGNVYAGIEDVTDNTSGIAAVLRTSKVMYDGGQISNTISADEYGVQSAVEAYWAILDERALDVSNAWVQLERYKNLNVLISGRLAVLDPLIEQLERVANAGVGDATQVAAAQRTVSMIRVTQTDVQERLAQAELKFTGFSGKLPNNTTFDSHAIAKAIPRKITGEMVMAAPGLLSSYAAYLGALESLQAAKARNSVTVGFESVVQRPFGQSGYDSDESVGLVVSKQLYSQDKLENEILAAQAEVSRQEATVKNVYRRGKQAVEAATLSILSMDKAIGMARSNATALSDEINLLRKQLVIGQSTLESVLSAEARLYDAESKEINFNADKQSSQLAVLSAIGLLSPFFGLKVENALK
jgi:adhesin transport system outer membrane protein